MTSEEIETFLAIQEAGSVTRAGERLFISQGTVSLRLKNLEEELQTALFSRGKGIKQLSLTPQGKAFLPIAQHLRGLLEEAGQIRNSSFFRPLRICASDQINTSTLISFYRDFPERHPEIALRIWTEHDKETYHYVDSHACDIGFCTTPYYYADVNTEPLYEVRRVFLCEKDSPFCTSRSLADLDPEKEVHVSYPTAYDPWRRELFSHQRRCLIEVGTLSMMPHFLGRDGTWAILPADCAAEFALQNDNLAIVESPVPIPSRILYILTHKNPTPGTGDLIARFREEVFAHVVRE